MSGDARIPTVDDVPPTVGYVSSCILGVVPCLVPST